MGAFKANSNSIDCLTCGVFNHMRESNDNTSTPSGHPESIHRTDSILTSSHPRHHNNVNSTCDFSNAFLSPTLDFCNAS